MRYLFSGHRPYAESCEGDQDRAVDIVQPFSEAADCQNLGIITRSPPFMADWWAQMPARVQFTEVSASGNGAN